MFVTVLTETALIENAHIEVYLYAAAHGCEIWILAVMEDHTLRS
jgi:hypothetical protein